MRELELFGTSGRAQRPLSLALALAATLASVACGDVAPPPTDDTPIAGAAGVSTGSGGSTPQAGSAGAGSKANGGSGGSGAQPGQGGTGTGGSTGGTGGTQAQGGLAGMPPIGGELSDCDTPGPRLIRRLTSVQFRNTLVDVFQDPNVPTADVLADPEVMRFRVDADKPLVRDLDASLLLAYAESVAAWAVSTNKLGAFTSCMTNDEGCFRPFIENLGMRLYREPLSQAQVDAYLPLFQAESTFADGASVVIMAMLQSPYVLYRRELGAPDSAAPAGVALTPHELASELSYFVTNSAPDAALLDAAANGRLASREDLDREAQRLLNTEAGRVALNRFVSSWFELDELPNKAKQATVYDLTPAMRTSMLGETREFFLDAFFNSGDVKGLLTGAYTFVDGSLASFYGLPGGGGSGFQRVDLTGSNRAPGLLGQAAFLTQHAQPENSSPVQRGRFVRDRLLCETILPMPPGVDVSLADGASYTTNRERYEEHSRRPLCAGCHLAFDPVGFTFEHFDGFGRYRDQEKGAPIDATGSITHVNADSIEVETPLDGLTSLTDYLGDNDQVRACVVRYWSYYAHGRDNWQEKKCNDDSVRREASGNGYTLQSILMGILHAPTFTRRVQDQ